MDKVAIAFKAVAILHSVAGYVLFGFVAQEEVHEKCIYKGRNPLTGDSIKYLAYFGCWSLIVCGPMAFVFPTTLAVLAAWFSIAFFLLTALADWIDKLRWPKFCKACGINLAVRVVGAATLTILAHRLAG